VLLTLYMHISLIFHKVV